MLFFGLIFIVVMWCYSRYDPDILGDDVGYFSRDHKYPLHKIQNSIGLYDS